MLLSSDDLQNLKSLHTLTKIPINVYDAKGENVHQFNTNAILVPYSLTDKFTKVKIMSVHHGEFHEIFLTFAIKKAYVTIGPIINQVPQKETLAEASPKIKEYLKSIPVVFAEDLRALLTIVDRLFSLNLEALYEEHLQNLINTQKETLCIEQNLLDKEAVQAYITPFYLEHRLFSLIAKGNPNSLKQLIDKIPLGILPVPNGNSIRSEKNYCIVLIEKISLFTIQMGLSIQKSLSMRRFFIEEVEKQDTLIDVLTIRDSAIIHFTEAMHDISAETYSLSIRKIIQYIELHIYDALTLTEIAQHFYISETNLRRTFKNEVGVSIGSYIQQQKIIAAKFLLLSDMPPNQVAKTLQFHDASHFGKIFKKHTQMTPLQFQKQKFPDSVLEIL